MNGVSRSRRLVRDRLRSYVWSLDPLTATPRPAQYVFAVARAVLHADEIHTDVPLARRLLAAQFPEWAALPIEPVPAAGTDNALYRLGDDMVVRLPASIGLSTMWTRTFGAPADGLSPLGHRRSPLA